MGKPKTWKQMRPKIMALSNDSILGSFLDEEIVETHKVIDHILRNGTILKIDDYGSDLFAIIEQKNKKRIRA